jgi:hypothetical protein
MPAASAAIGIQAVGVGVTSDDEVVSVVMVAILGLGRAGSLIRRRVRLTVRPHPGRDRHEALTGNQQPCVVGYSPDATSDLCLLVYREKGERMNAQQLLRADGPYPDLADELMLYGQFVGTWQVDNSYFRPDGTVHVERRSWHFDWMLGGRGVIDVIVPDGAPSHEYGVTLRCYDADLDAWHITWRRPSDGQFAEMIGRASAEGIVQDGADDEDTWRWTFTDIRPDSFLWQGFSSSDGGLSWTRGQEMRARRSSIAG